MYGFGKKLSKDNIYEKISSYDIFKHYSDNFQTINKNFSSDFGEDSVPSCCIAQINGDLLYTDFRTNKSYRAIPFVMEKLGLTYFEALQQINVDFNLKLGENYPLNFKFKSKKGIIHPPKKIIEKPPSIIQKKQRPFTKKDLEYWNKFYWTEEMLTKSNTQSISHYWINGTMFIVKPKELAFSYEYYYNNKRKQRKLYFPERTNFKWFSNTDNTIVQLVDVMPKYGDVLFITSSKKDAGIFWRLQLDNMFPNKIIHGVAPNTEGGFPIEKWFLKIKERYKHVIIWYDNDSTGIQNAKKYSEIYNIPYMYNPENTPKDPSDFAKSLGLNEFYKLLKQKIDELQ